jgi:hypothetical protein
VCQFAEDVSSLKQMPGAQQLGAPARFGGLVDGQNGDMDKSEDARSAAERLDDAGYEAFHRGDVVLAERLHTEGLALARESGDAAAIVTALAGLMRVALRSQDWSRLAGLCSEGSAIARACGDDTLLRMPLHMSAEGARMRGELSDARRLYRDSIGLNQRLGNDGMVGVECGNLAWVEIDAGDLEEARRLIEVCERATEADDAYGLAFVKLTRARLALASGDPSGAQLLDLAIETLENAGLVWDPAEQRSFDETRAMTDANPTD